MSPRMQRQLSFSMPAQRRHAREARNVHDAILRLRAAGYAVRRNGRHHKVNLRRLTTAELLRLAAQLDGAS